jgi:hypothetical protein
MKTEIELAWEKAQAAWEAAGKTTPCYDPLYMAARAELAAAHKRVEAEHWRWRAQQMRQNYGDRSCILRHLSTLQQEMSDAKGR